MLVNLHPADIPKLVLRPCIVKAKKSGPKEARTDRKAYFHSLFYTSNGGGQILMLVEFEDGHCEQIQPKNIIFTDGGNFDKWEDKRNEKSKEE